MRRAGAGTIMEFWTLEGCTVGFLVVAVVVRIILGGDEVAGSVLSGGSFEDAFGGNLEGVRPGEGVPLGVSQVTEVGTIQGPDGEVLGITLVVADISKPGVDEGSGLFLLGGYFEDAFDGSLDSAGPGEGDPLGNSEVTMAGNKLCISDGEGLGITLGVADRSNLGGDE